LVFVLDDDLAVGEALDKLLSPAGYSVVTLRSAEELFQRLPVSAPACLVLDVALHGTNGLDLQRQLSEREHTLPIVFITAQADISVSVRAMKAGAVGFLSKPFADEELLSGIRQGLDEAHRSWTARRELRTLREHYDQLTLRQRQVLELVVSGLSNKQVASELSIAEATVKIHRGQAMHKMHAGSLAELVRMASRMSLPLRGTGNDM
jgi:FixJ family two-component response regulator